MLTPTRTPRQRMIELLIGTRLATHQLAQMLGIPERQVEDHLGHVVKSIAHDKTRCFILEPSRCQDCDFVFRDRRRLTRPSRCPQCHSEDIAAPRYGIDLVGPPSGRKDNRTTTHQGATRKDHDDRDTLPTLCPVLQSSAGMLRR